MCSGLQPYVLQAATPCGPQERQLEHAHRLAALQLRLSLLRTPRQAGTVRARAASLEGFVTFWAELRRDKKIYFYREMPTQAHARSGRQGRQGWP